MRENVVTVLLVEDDPDLITLLGELLPVFGFETERAAHGGLALEKLQLGQLPDIILLDWFLPVLSGEEFLRAKKRIPKIRDIPVIVMSGAKDIRRLLQGRTDINSVLEKPVGVDDIVHAIQSALPPSPA